MSSGCLKDGTELISEALGLFNNVYGVMHSEIGTSFRSIARINYVTGDYAEAVSNQQKATIMFERVFGKIYFLVYSFGLFFLCCV